jgi:hypothetical protein
MGKRAELSATERREAVLSLSRREEPGTIITRFVITEELTGIPTFLEATSCSSAETGACHSENLVPTVFGRESTKTSRPSAEASCG